MWKHTEQKQTFNQYTLNFEDNFVYKIYVLLLVIKMLQSLSNIFMVSLDFFILLKFKFTPANIVEYKYSPYSTKSMNANTCQQSCQQ